MSGRYCTPMGKGVVVHSSDMSISGKTTGGERRCGMEGCGGRLVGVRWVDGKLTFPCVRGMKQLSDGSYQIL